LIDQVPQLPVGPVFHQERVFVRQKYPYNIAVQRFLYTVIYHITEPLQRYIVVLVKPEAAHNEFGCKQRALAVIRRKVAFQMHDIGGGKAGPYNDALRLKAFHIHAVDIGARRFGGLS
jgi:hypothetical protein